MAITDRTALRLESLPPRAAAHGVGRSCCRRPSWRHRQAARRLPATAVMTQWVTLWASMRASDGPRPHAGNSFVDRKGLDSTPVAGGRKQACRCVMRNQLSHGIQTFRTSVRRGAVLDPPPRAAPAGNRPARGYRSKSITSCEDPVLMLSRAARTGAPAANRRHQAIFGWSVCATLFAQRAQQSSSGCVRASQQDRRYLESLQSEL
jgi:hypothetical protein